MATASSPVRLSWKIRLAALIAASVLSLSLLVVYVAGIKFVRLVTKVSAEIAQSEPAPPPSKPAPQEKGEEGIVSVRILPGGKKDD